MVNTRAERVKEIQDLWFEEHGIELSSSETEEVMGNLDDFISLLVEWELKKKQQNEKENDNHSRCEDKKNEGSGI